MTTLPAPKRRGRPRGSKNKATILREQVRSDIRERAGDLVLDKAEAVIKTVVEQALEGCRVSQKMLLDRFLPAHKAVDGADSGNTKPVVNISIQGTPGPDAPGVIIEGPTTEED